MGSEMCIRDRLYVSGFDCSDDDRRPCMSGKSRSSERRAFTVLTSVCWDWRHTVTGWPDSPTGLWVRHQLTKLVQRECVYSPYVDVYNLLAAYPACTVSSELLGFYFIFYLPHSYYSMGQIIKSFCVCACVRVSVRLWTLSRSHFFVDFHQIGHMRLNPQK